MTDLIDPESRHSRALRAQMDADEEALRVKRWHATYNAAMTGLLARGQSMSLQCTEDCVAEAKVVANLTHGELSK